MRYNTPTQENGGPEDIFSLYLMDLCQMDDLTSWNPAMPEHPQDDDLVMKLVEQSLARPSEARESYLRGECADDSELFHQAWQYVQWEERMNGFLLESLCSALSERHFDPGEVL